MQPSTTSDRAPIKAVVLDDRRPGLHRLQHAADPHAARQVHVLADLRAAADGGPCIHHRARVHIGPRGSRNSASAPRPARYRPSGARRSWAPRGKPADFHSPSPQRGPFAVDLVPPAAALGAARLHFHVLQAEAQQHRLFRPLVHVPVAVVLPLGHAQRPAVERGQRRLDRLARLTLGGGGDRVAGPPTRLRWRLPAGRWTWSGLPRGSMASRAVIAGAPPGWQSDALRARSAA